MDVDSTWRDARPYSKVFVALHWLLAIALIAQLALGWWMLDVPKSPPGVRAGWFNLHKSIGITIGLLVLARVVWRLTQSPFEDALLAPWQRTAARITHGLIYASLLALPLSGYLGSYFTRYPVRYFGWVLPGGSRDWPAAKALMSSIHYAAACIFIGLLLLHMTAALWHWWRRDGVAERMGLPSLPGK